MCIVGEVSAIEGSLRIDLGEVLRCPFHTLSYEPSLIKALQAIGTKRQTINYQHLKNYDLDICQSRPIAWITYYHLHSSVGMGYMQQDDEPIREKFTHTDVAAEKKKIVR